MRPSSSKEMNPHPPQCASTTPQLGPFDTGVWKCRNTEWNSGGSDARRLVRSPESWALLCLARGRSRDRDLMQWARLPRTVGNEILKGPHTFASVLIREVLKTVGRTSMPPAPLPPHQQLSVTWPLLEHSGQRKRVLAWARG